MENEQLPSHVWYVAYGSNLNRDRFMKYIAGGIVAATGRRHVGCRKHTPPSGDQAFEFAGGLYFAQLESHWGGGVAFVDLEMLERRVLGRAYRVLTDQFLDILWQENDDNPRAPRLRLDVAALLRNGAAQVCQPTSKLAGLPYPHARSSCGD